MTTPAAAVVVTSAKADICALTSSNRAAPDPMACRPARSAAPAPAAAGPVISDESDSSATGSLWQRHPRTIGDPSDDTGAGAPTLSPRPVRGTSTGTGHGTGTGSTGP